MLGPDEIRSALAELITERREDFAGLSRLLGRNSAYVQQYIRRGTPRVLSERDRRRLAEYFGVSGDRLGLDDLVPAQTPGLIPIPKYSVGASAGHGAVVDEELESADFAFSSRWLSRVARSRAGDLSIIRVQGDSMLPTLADGDEIMVDRSAAFETLRDGIYVIRSDDSLLVKRVAVHPTRRRLTISSDNSAYVSWPDCSPEDVDIVGRVVWAGRTFR